MESIQITKRITSQFDFILIAKIRNFTRRSLWKYLVASIFIAIAYPDLFGSPFKTLFFIFAIVCVLSLSVIYLSSRIQAKENLFDADVTFTVSEIIIEHKNKALTEKKDWNWIIHSVESKSAFILLIQTRPRFEIYLLKEKLNTEEMNQFRAWLVK